MNFLQPQGAASPERPRLLLVDDERANILSLHSIFQADCDLFMATSGQEALRFCQTQRLPDLILLDIVMPGMDGLELCRQLKTDAATAHIPILFVTGLSRPEEEVAALQAGGVDFIAKPVNPVVVRARVNTHLLLKTQADQLRALAFIDGLTGVANRRRFDEALNVEWRQAIRTGDPVALLMLDIDHFKSYNDFYGHQAGDACLQQVAAVLPRHLLRPHDVAARYGGEEFACLLPLCDAPSAGAKAEDIRRAVEQLQLAHAASPVAGHVTVSIGVAALRPGAADLPGQLLAAADAVLYQAKSQGRNCVALAPDAARQRGAGMG